MQSTIEQVIRKLIARPTEEPWFDFKESWFDAKGIGEYIAALSNAAALAGEENGYLVWGINDKTHEVVGTTLKYQREYKGEPYEHFLARQLKPSISFNFSEETVEGERVVLLTVPAAKTTPTSFAGVRYSRIGSSKVKLERYPEREVELFEVLKHGLPTVETVPSSYTNLEFERLFTYFAGRGIKLRQETFETNLGLLTPDGKYNILAQLLSDDCHLPARVSIFQGATKASPLYSVREFGNDCILLTLDHILEYGDVLNIVQADERGRVTNRRDVRLFDPDAYREAVINAFVHNRWIDGNAPMISVFDDRIEILSHGALPAKQDLDDFFEGISRPVNQKLSDLFLQLHISERSGRGVPKIVSAYDREVFSFSRNSITVTLPFERVNSRAVVETDMKPLAGSLSKVQESILSLIRDNPNITQPQIVKRLNVSESTVYRGVTHLKDLGIIERVGSNKSGYWQVNAR